MHHVRLFLRIAGYIFLYFLVTSLVMLLMWGLLKFFDISFSRLTNELIADIISLIFIIIFFGLYKRDVMTFLFPARPKISRIFALFGLSVLTRVGIIVVVFVALIGLLLFTDLKTIDTIMDTFSAGKEFQWAALDKASQKEYFIGMISIILMAPVIEELFLRGVIFNKLKSFYSVRSSLIYTNILFMLMHFHPGLFPVTFIFGIAMTMVYIRWNNLAYPIILHMFFNMQPFILDYITTLLERS